MYIYDDNKKLKTGADLFLTNYVIKYSKNHVLILLFYFYYHFLRYVNLCDIFFSSYKYKQYEKEKITSAAICSFIISI